MSNEVVLAYLASLCNADAYRFEREIYRYVAEKWVGDQNSCQSSDGYLASKELT